MAEKTLAEKLAIKEGRKVLLVNAPRGYTTMLGDLPQGARLAKEGTGPADVIQVFVANREVLEAQLARLKTLLAPDGILWITYHKGTSAVKTDINRDSIARYAQTIGLTAVAMVAIDDDWAALRVKQA